MILKAVIIYLSVVTLAVFQHKSTISQVLSTFDSKNNAYLNVLNNENMDYATVRAVEDSAESNEVSNEAQTFLPQNFLKDIRNQMLGVMNQIANISKKSLLGPNFVEDIRNQMMGVMNQIANISKKSLLGPNFVEDIKSGMQEVMNDVKLNRGNLISMQKKVLNGMVDSGSSESSESSSDELIVPTLGPNWFRVFQRLDDSVEFPTLVTEKRK